MAEAAAVALPSVGTGTQVASQGASSTVLLRTSKQLQRKFKHAADFGVPGNFSKENAAKFSAAIHKHMNTPGVRKISGTYHKAPATHHIDPNTGLNVISSTAGEFTSGWKLSPAQMKNVLAHGAL